MLKPNPGFAEFSRRLKRELKIFQPWKGMTYRVTTLKHRDPRIILFGEGSYRNGGRWNAIDSFRAVYGSVDDVTALKESKANAEYANLPYPFRETRLIVAVDMSLSRVVDLTARETLRALDVTEEELRTEDWRKVQEQGFESLTQALGRAVFEAKGEGLLAFSARVAKAINVAYFPQNKLRASEVRLCEAQELHNLGLE
jgi:RES domain-containing protein